MKLRPSLISALSLALFLVGCGYGWEEQPRVYPPSGANTGKGQVVQGAAVAGPNEHLVQPGDTLYAIGFKNQIDWKDLASWNGIGGDYVIRPGQILRLTPPDQSESIQTQALGASSLGIAAVNTGPSPIAIPPGAPAPVAVPSPLPLPAPVPAPVLPAPAASSKPAVAAAAPPPPPSVVSAVAAGSSIRWSWPSGGKVQRGYNLAAGAKGIDIAGDVGQPVKATAAGKVVYSGSALKGYGELIIVKHDDTYLSAYGYNRVRLVKEGDEIRAGQTIAELGMGPEQKPVLHFEIREHGKPVDPLKFLPAP